MCGIISINLETLMVQVLPLLVLQPLSCEKAKWHYLIGSAIIFYINLKHNNYNIG